MAAETSTGVWLTLASGFLAIAGIGAKGVADIYLERAKLDSQLIIGALSSPSVETRRESLRLLVDTGLIADGNARKALKQYFEGDSPRVPPQLSPFVQSGEVRTLTPPDEIHASKTDIDLFVCGSAKANDDAKGLIDRIHDAIDHSNHFGAVNLQVWDGSWYEQIPEQALAGRTTLVLDSKHPEKAEEPALRDALKPLTDMPPLGVVNNTGTRTPWRLTLIVCPKPA